VDDHELAGWLAHRAGETLLQLRDDALRAGESPWRLQDRGDGVAHRLLLDELASHRPDDVVLSEEGADSSRRLAAARVWIVDPLDGSYDYPEWDSVEWAVHVALVTGGAAVAGAVAVPGRQQLFGTAVTSRPGPSMRARPVIVTNRSYAGLVNRVAAHVGADVVPLGSAGVKAMAVVAGEADAYIHSSGLYEWDVCAPAAVALAAGLHVSDLAGTELRFNQPRPVVSGLLMCRPELAEPLLDALR
jgi:3'(2'), 5'-bisphosphate nucleotidase